MNHRQKPLFSACLIALGALLSTAPIQGAWAAATAPSLGGALTFGALGGAGVTCESPVSPPTVTTTVTGDVGAPGTALTLVTGFPPPTPSLCSLSGTVRLGLGSGPGSPYRDFQTAYTNFNSTNPCPGVFLPNELGGLTLAPGVYCINGVETLTAGNLTLDLTATGGDGSGIWIFNGVNGGSLTTTGVARRSTVVMAHGGSACNVYWGLATAATFSNTDFVGNVLAGSKITFTHSTLAGRALANTESVTMTFSSITSCDGTQPPPPPPTCDRDHKHHKHCKHNEHDKPHCDGDDDGHDNGGHDNGGHDNDGHDNGGHDNDGHDKDGHDKDGHDKDGRGGH